MRALGEGREAGCGHSCRVADRAVGDDAGRAQALGAQGQNIADGAGCGVAARLDHQHLAWLEGVEGAFLGVVAAAVGLEEVGPVRHETEGSGQARPCAFPA